MHNVKRRVKDYAARLLSSHYQRSSESTREPESGRSTSREPEELICIPGNVDNITHNPQALELSSIVSNLPPELLVQIFGYTEPLAVVRCRIVCRQFQQIIDGTPEIQYMLELYICGYRNNEADTSTIIPCRLEALISEYFWWKSHSGYSWKRGTFDSSLRHSNLQPDQYYDNLWLIPDVDPSILEEEDVPSFRVNVLKCVCFEETLEGSPIVDSWTLSFNFNFDAFVAEPSRGVLHLVRLLNVSNCKSFRVRTASLTDGSILSDHLFEGEPDEDEIPWALDFCMYCDDDLLICTTWVDGIIGRHPSLVGVVLLDTKSGRIVATYSRHVTTSAEVSLQLLTKDVYLLHIMETGCFTTEVYKLIPTPTYSALKIHHVATFEFPRMHRKFAKHWTFSITPTHFQGGRLSRNAPPPPFIRAQTTPLVVIHRSFVNNVLQHYVSASVFTSLAERFDPSAQPHSTPLIIPWKSWGPENSRCFQNTVFRGTRIGRCFGSQVLLPDLTCLDFNTKALYRYLQRSGIERPKLDASLQAYLPDGRRMRLFRKPVQAQLTPPESELMCIPATIPRVIMSPTIIPKGRMFEEDIVTVLPYRESKLECDGLEEVFRFYGDTWLVCDQGHDNLVYYLLDRRAPQATT